MNYNNLNSIPPEIGNLNALSLLNLDGNNLAALPNEIGLLKKLWELSLSDNKIEEIPTEIGQLTALRSLNLKDNRLRSLPSEMGNLKELCFLYLDSNELTSIPAELGELSNLEQFNVQNNQLTVFPSSLFSLYLCDLNIENNAFSSATIEAITTRVNAQNDNGPYIEYSIHDIHKSSLVTANDLPSIVTRWKTGLVKLSEEVKDDLNYLWKEKSTEST